MAQEGNYITIICQNCGSTFTYVATGKGGRPRKFCDAIKGNRTCSQQLHDRERASRITKIHFSYNRVYYSLDVPKRQAMLHGLFSKYVKRVAGIKGGLSADESRALTTSRMFENSYYEVNGNREKSIYHIFVSFCHEVKKINPFNLDYIKSNFKIILGV